jgi:uncharacterized protein YcbK (DUF882 family)
MLGGALVGGAALALPFPAMAVGTEWRLAIRNVHNNETVDALFARNGTFLPEGLAELNHGLRDWRTGESTVMDSPATNAALRAKGGEHTGVASQSQHMLGKATDIMVPGVTLDRLHGAALALGGGGVGYYPRDGFVHVDTGRVRHW